MSATLGHFRAMRISCAVIMFLIQTSHCLDTDAFSVVNGDKNCLKFQGYCCHLLWTNEGRLMVKWHKKCVGVPGKSVGSELNLYDCDETSDLQKWECKNETLLALKDEELYLEINDKGGAALSRTIGPRNYLTMTGTSNGVCTKTFRELYTIEGNAFGRPCMFPFLYKNIWYDDCTPFDSATKRLWCAAETRFQNELWGYCPTNSKETWKKHPLTGVSYQINTQSVLTWSQAHTSCKQQSACLLSITSPGEQVYISEVLGAGNPKIWNGLILDPEHGWQWSDRSPYRYLKWDGGFPSGDPGHNCAVMDSNVQYSWQSSTCSKKLGYICKSKGPIVPPTEVVTGFCSNPWIPYNGHCFHLNRTRKTWSDAKLECRKEGGDLVSIRNVEDQSFVISQLGYAITDELWIGLNDKRTEGLFDWTDHSYVTFTSWTFGEPAVSANQEDCVLMRGENGNWADRTCEENHGFICMKQSASQPSGEEAEQNIGCKTGWKRHGSYCYFVGSETKTFDQAKDLCTSSGSYLADVSNGVDNAFLVSLVGLRPEKNFWLGLSNQKNIENFVWTNTNTVGFTHWNAEMPGHHQGCVALATGIYAGLWDVLPCNNKEKYICKHLAEGAVLTPPPPTRSPPQCADGWNPVGSRNFCSKAFLKPRSAKKTWYEARDYCRAIGGDLLSIHSAAELHMRTRNGLVWIGLSAPDPAIGYVWSDGSPLNFQNWKEGEPNNKNNVESCAQFYVGFSSGKGSWNDIHCESYSDWLCQIRAGLIPTTPPPDTGPDYNKTTDGWLIWRGDQYYINDRLMAMEDARHYCQQHHGDLVVINSEVERVFLWKQVSRKGYSYYIGLTVDIDGTFGWMDGSPVVFQSWNEGQPDFHNNDENCVFMDSSMGFWSDRNCGIELKSICKRSGSPPTNTTAAPTMPPRGGCPLYWVKFNLKCFSFNKQMDTWRGARTQCQAAGGNLASILSRRENVFVLNQMAADPTNDLWIGFTNPAGNPYRWTDGRPVGYINFGIRRDIHPRFDRDWSPMRYGYGEQKCVVINTNPTYGLGSWMSMSCNDTHGFVCVQNLNPNLPDSPQPPIPSTYVKVGNDSLKAVNKNMTWEEARKNCRADEADLASVRKDWTKTHIDMLAISLQTPLWIGLNKMETGGYFKYVDGWHMSLVKWAVGEPSRERPCVYVDEDGRWKTAHCNQTMSSVCMKSTDVAPKENNDFPGICPEETEHYGRSYTWRPFKGHCYIFVTRRENWADASVSCTSRGGLLASIEDPSEQDFIQSTIKGFQDSESGFWLGLFKNHKGLWLWLDETVLDYTNWGTDEPDRESHGRISSADGTWGTTSRRYSRPYICKAPKMIPNVPTSSAGILDIQRSHTAVTVVAIITGFAMGAAIVFFIHKRSRHLAPIQEKLTTFENPVFHSNEQCNSDGVDTSKLVENTSDQSSEPETSTELVVTG
ncbi:macrophage mannose receptor 1-like isoform X1 [Genypterus blacodes]|uniref:macrophage mannose receptor 1-like isoform X1 n=1 Tax=Genypterus blacodes TaxID=154954 RepID=UPI003F75BD6F